jgi:hypothetical protein
MKNMRNYTIQTTPYIFPRNIRLALYKTNTLAYHEIWYFMHQKSVIIFSLQLGRKITPNSIYLFQFFKVNLLFQLSFVNLFHNCNYTFKLLLNCITILHKLSYNFVPYIIHTMQHNRSDIKHFLLFIYFTFIKHFMRLKLIQKRHLH